MSIADFQNRQKFLDLVDQVRSSLGYSIKQEELNFSEDIAVEMSYGGLQFAIVHSVRNSSEKILIECIFGEIPKNIEQEVIINLLKMNTALAEIDQIVFCIDPETDKVIFTTAFCLLQIDVSHILRKMTETVWHGRRWAENYFINSSESQTEATINFNILA